MRKGRAAIILALRLINNAYPPKPMSLESNCLLGSDVLFNDNRIFILPQAANNQLHKVRLVDFDNSGNFFQRIIPLASGTGKTGRYDQKAKARDVLQKRLTVPVVYHSTYARNADRFQNVRLASLSIASAVLYNQKNGNADHHEQHQKG